MREYNKEQLKRYWNRSIKEYEKQPTQNEWIERTEYPSISIIKKNYGSWNNFVREMGGQIKCRTYTQKDLKEYWNRWLKEYRKQPTSIKWDEKKGFPSLIPIKNLYGSWNNFVKAMGRKPFKLVCKKQELKAYYDKWLGKYNKQPTYEEWQEEESFPSPMTVAKFYSSWNNFVKVMGGKPKLQRHKQEKFEKCWNKLIKEHKGQTPTQEEWEKEKGYPSLHSLADRYGSWNNFVREMGGTPNRVYRVYSKEDLKEFWAKWSKENNGKVPTVVEWGKKSYPSFTSIKNLYGSWNNFVKAMGGIPYNEKWDDAIHRRKICDKIIAVIGKKPNELIMNDFMSKSKKLLGKNYGGILYYYLKKFCLQSRPKALELLIKDLYGVNRKEENKFSKQEGIDAYIRYYNKCKAEGKRVGGIRHFFTSFDPITLKLAEGTPPLRKYVSRYSWDMKKLEGKVE